MESSLNGFDIDKVLEAMAAERSIRINDYAILNREERPFSDVFRVRLNIDKDSSAFVFIKYLKSLARNSNKEALRKNYETTQFWFEKFRDSKQFRTIEPLYINYDNYAIITRESPGYDLNRYIEHYGQFFPPLQTQKKIYKNLYNVGQWLSYFQSIPVNGREQPLSLEDILDYINLRLERIVENSKIAFNDNLAGRINDYIGALWADIREADKRQCYLHSDLSLSNILIHRDTVTVLDFGKIETGSIYKDLTRLYHQLMLLGHKPTFLKGFLSNLKENLLAGYGDVNASHNPLFRIYLLTHIINHFGKTARFWEHSFTENIYNRWIVKRTLKEIKEFIS